MDVTEAWLLYLGMQEIEAQKAAWSMASARSALATKEDFQQAIERLI